MMLTIIFSLLAWLLPLREIEQSGAEDDIAALPDSRTKYDRLTEQLFRTDYGTAAFERIEGEVLRLAEIYA